MSGTEQKPVAAGHSLLKWAAREQDATVRMVCGHAAERVVAGRDEVVVAWRGCLAQIPAALPFELLVQGVARVLLDHTWCEAPWACDWTGLATVAHVSDRLEVVAEPPEGARRPKQVLDADAMPVLRRRSLVGLGAVGEAGDPEPPDRGTAQQRLRAAVRGLAADLPPALEPEEGWTSGALDLVSEGCVACRVCVRSCPEQALALETGNGRAGLGFDPSLCTGCGKCLTVCDARALAERGRLGPPALLMGPVLLELFEIRTCTRCRSPFRGLGEYCAVCQFRVANPFGSTTPPGWVPGS